MPYRGNYYNKVLNSMHISDFYIKRGERGSLICFTLNDCIVGEAGLEDIYFFFDKGEREARHILTFN